MKIAVIGATGMVGSAITAEAVARGHEVSAYSRSGKAVTGAQAASATLTDTAKLVDIINTHDLTVIAVASRDNFDAVTAAHNELIAAKPSGRVLVVGGAGALTIDGKRLYETPEFPAEYLTEAKTFASIYDAYVAAGESLNWTIIAPSPLIEPGDRTGNYVTGLDSPAGNYVSAEDFAVAAIDEAEQPQHANRRFTVATAN